MSDNLVQITLRQQKDYQFNVDFGNGIACIGGDLRGGFCGTGNPLDTCEKTRKYQSFRAITATILYKKAGQKLG